MGKGSQRRPMEISQAEWERRWGEIFKKPPRPSTPPKSPLVFSRIPQQPRGDVNGQ